MPAWQVADYHFVMYYSRTNSFKTLKPSQKIEISYIDVKLSIKSYSSNSYFLNDYTKKIVT